MKKKRGREAVCFDRRSKARILREASWLWEPRADPLLRCGCLESRPSTLVRPGLSNTSASSPMELADRTDHLPLSFLPVFQWYDARTSAKGFSACYTFRIEAQFLEFGIKKYITNHKVVILNNHFLKRNGN